VTYNVRLDSEIVSYYAIVIVEKRNYMRASQTVFNTKFWLASSTKEARDDNVSSKFETTDP
jgi:hypothetical protein